MLTIKRIRVLVIITFLILPSLEARADPVIPVYGFFISPIMGILYGHAEEILYKYPGKDQYVSQLLWDLQPVYYAGLALDLGPRDPFVRHGFIAAASLKFGFPGKSGRMEDRDWQYPDNERLTNFSRHDAYSKNAVLGDLSLGYSWGLQNIHALRASLDFSYMYLSWSAEDGYFQYLDTDNFGNFIPGQTWNDKIRKEYVHGTGIEYTQIWFIISPGLSIKSKLSGALFLEGSLSYSPIIYSADRDDHLIPDRYYNGKRFSGYFFGGHYIESGGGFVFSYFRNLDLCFSVSYRYITGLRGGTKYEYMYYGGSAGRSSNNAYDGGTGYSALDIGLTARFSIYGRD